METELVLVTPAMLALVPIVVGLVQVAKIYIDSKWAPLLSLLFGVGGSFLLPIATIPGTLIGGIIIGLSASGLYGQAKKVME